MTLARFTIWSQNAEECDMVITNKEILYA